MDIDEVYESRHRLCDFVMESSDAFPGVPPLAAVEVDGVIVIKDEVAHELLATYYVSNTHIVPHGLPGVGIFSVTRDKDEGVECLVIDGDALTSGIILLHQLRRYEDLFITWSDQRATFLTQARAIHEHWRRLRNASKKEEVKGSERLYHYTPSRLLLETLPCEEDFSLLDRMSASLRSHVSDSEIDLLCRTIREHHKNVAPYLVIEKALKELDPDVLKFASPYLTFEKILLMDHLLDPHEVIHVLPPSDNLLLALPGIAALEATRKNVELSQGALPGHRISLLPSKEILDTIQHLVDADAFFHTTWKRLNVSTLEGDVAQEWYNATLRLKEKVVARMVAPYIAHNVLGFDTFVRIEENDVLLRPIVSETHLSMYGARLQDIHVMRLPFSNVFVDISADEDE